MNILHSIQMFIYSLNPSYVGIAATLCMIVCVICASIVIGEVLRSQQMRKLGRFVKDNTQRLIIKGMRASSIKTFNYDAIEDYIRSSGLGFMTKDKMTPLMYILLRIGVALITFIYGLQINLLVGLIFIPVGYLGVDFIINMSDKSDNDKMLTDIENVYDTLRLQTKAGVYITSVLTDCYLVVGNKRLKSAFLNLTSDIAAKNDIEVALENFRSRFRNEYMDTLVIIIKQSMQTGQAAKMFDDIKAQIDDINSAMIIAEKNKINSAMILVQVLLYTAIVLVIAYISYVTLTGGLGLV